MKKHNRFLSLLKGAVLATALSFASQAGAQTVTATNWTAFNDQLGLTEAVKVANATGWSFHNASAYTSGVLKDIQTGNALPVTVTLTSSANVAQGATMGAPASGTPAYNWFNPYITFASGNNDDAIQLNGFTVTYAFTGLDASKRYRLRGTANRDASGNLNRWTYVTIDSTDSYVHAHTPAYAAAGGGYVLSTTAGVAGLTANQVAWRVGYDTVGTLISFDLIAPGADGSFSVTLGTFKGTVPGQATDGSYGYAFTAFSLEEFSTGAPQPPSFVTQPPATFTTNEGYYVSIPVVVQGASPMTYQWYKGASAVLGQTNASLVFTNILSTDSGSYKVLVSNSLGSSNSTTCVITVIADTTKPTLVAGLGLLKATNWCRLPGTAAAPPVGFFSNVGTQPPDYASILVSFSKPLDAVTATDPSKYTVYESGNKNATLGVNSATLINNTNVLLNTFARTVGINYTVEVTGVKDRTAAGNVIVAASTNNIYHEVSLIDYSANNNWYISEQGDDRGTNWYATDNTIAQESSFYSAGGFPGEGTHQQFFLDWYGSGDNPFSMLPEETGYRMDERSINNIPGSTPGATNRPTTYFRTHFTFPTQSDPSVADLRLRYVVDDGAVFYMNGVELTSVGMPTNRPVSYTNWANRTAGNVTIAGATYPASYEPLMDPYAVIQPYYSMPNATLVPGDNVMAIELHNASATSSDLYLGVIFSAVVPPYGAGIKPTITSQPTNLVVAAGGTAKFSVQEIGTKPVTYTWYRGTTVVPGATNSLTLTNVTSANAGNYTVIIANTQGKATSVVATLTVLYPAIITQQPVAVTATNGQRVEFSVTATVSVPATYQWYLNGAAISGANATNYVIASAQIADGGLYYVSITDLGGVTNSATVRLTMPVNTVAPVIVKATGLLYATNAPATQNPKYTEILLQFNEPMQRAAATTIGNYQVKTTVGATTLPVVKAELIQQTNILITTSTPRTPGVNYTVTCSNLKDASFEALPLANGVVNIYHEISLLPIGASTDATTSWKYTDYVFDGGTVPWKTAAYDDAAWKLGYQMFGAKNGAFPATTEAITTTMTPIVTTTSVGYVTTYYFRRNIVWPANANPALAEIRLRSIVDDGAVMYVNGSEFYRIRLTPTIPAYTDLAAGAAGDPVPYDQGSSTTALIQPYTVVPNTNFVIGNNMVAVELHQSSTNSSDVYLMMTLSAIIPPYGTVFGPPTITQNPQSQTGTNGQTITFTVAATVNPPASYQWYFGNAPIGANSTNLVINNATEINGGNYFVVVTDGGGSATSLVARLTMPVDTTAPTLVKAIGLLYATNAPPTKASKETEIVLEFSKPILASTVGNLANYQVQVTGGGAPLTVVSAELVRQTNVLITTATPRTPGVNYTVTVSNLKDTSVTGNTLVTTSFNIFHEISLISVGTTNDVTASWKYTDTLVDYSNAWSQVGFDDSTWKTGWMLFGAKTVGVAVPGGQPETNVTTMAGVSTNATEFPYVVTYYFRHTFSWPAYADRANAELRLRDAVDDGAIFHINGAEAYRYNISNTVVNFMTYAGPLVPGSVAVYEPATDTNALIQPAQIIPTTNIVVGNNQMAVEVHQVNGNSSDAFFSMVLTAIVPPYGSAPAEVRIDTTKVEGNVITIGFTGVAGKTYQLFYRDDVAGTGWTAIPGTVSGAGAHTLQATTVGSKRFYRVGAL